MIYAIVSVDKGDASEQRKAARPLHKEYVKGIADKIVDAGAVLRCDGEVASTVLIIEVESLEEAEQIAARDPYVESNIFASRIVGAFRMSHRDGLPKT